VNRDGDNSAAEATTAEVEEVKMWLHTQRRLVAMLQRAATICNQSLDENHRRKYFCSSKTRHFSAVFAGDRGSSPLPKMADP